ncbi:MAG: esterase family protein [Planctomycetes bacterium]|nr:esterase family protein [Planctomycetota bacterium]
MKKILLGLCMLFAGISSAAEPAKVAMKSEVLGKDMSFSILLPNAYKTEPTKRFPVIYMLDGWGGNGMGLFYNNAIGQRPFIQNFADENQVIVINFGLPAEWYFDAPMDPKLKFGTFLTTELIDHVDKNYRTLAKREGRAIAGISSGAHGAFLLAFQHPELYIAAGSLAGCPDLTHYVGSRPDWKLPHVLGPHPDHADHWVQCSIEPYLKNIKNQGMGVWFGCGLSDELNADNRKLEQQMKALGIEHTYHEAAGGHNGQYLSGAFQVCMNALVKHLQR